MKKYKLLVFSNFTPGKEAEYNRWYDEVHIPDVLKVPGFIGASRYKLSDVTGEGAKHSYCAIYDVESNEIGATLAELGAAASSGQMTMSDAIDLASTEMRAWEAR
ncbi:MAG TPA: DUF4286 family protein [Novosphingobium sp.]|nr:DUF4286 family protein [Novosphingobium sp.]